MCGRYRRTSDKQRIAEAFQVAAGLDEHPDEPGDDLCSQSLQPVVFTNDHGERQIELMRWAFKLPDKLLFNARSEGIEYATFWKDAFLTGRCIVPGGALYEWQGAFMSIVARDLVDRRLRVRMPSDGMKDERYGQQHGGLKRYRR